jgi:hypothetical protein
MIQRTLLSRNSQNPSFRRHFRCDPTIQADTTVTTIAGH